MKATPTVYLSGPIEGCNVVERDTWRGNAKELASDFQWLDPCRHNEDGFYDGKELPDELVVYDKQDILMSDFVLCNPWKKSEGTAMEILYAYYVNVPVVTVWQNSFPSINLWVRYHSHVILPSIEQAIEYMRDNSKYTTAPGLRRIKPPAPGLKWPVTTDQKPSGV